MPPWLCLRGWFLGRATPDVQQGGKPPHFQPRLKHPAVDAKAWILLQALPRKRWNSPKGGWQSTAPLSLPCWERGRIKSQSFLLL